jgi:hypothetical protein
MSIAVASEKLVTEIILGSTLFGWETLTGGAEKPQR